MDFLYVIAQKGVGESCNKFCNQVKVIVKVSKNLWTNLTEKKLHVTRRLQEILSFSQSQANNLNFNEVKKPRTT